MVTGSLKVGTRLIVKLPAGWETKYAKGHPEWIKVVHTLDGQKVTVNGGVISVFPGTVSMRVSIKGRPDIYLPMEFLVPEAASPVAIEMKSAVGFCSSCGGYGKHRLMCPVEKKKSG